MLLLRLIALVVSPIQLHGDEAQYWTWSQQLDWGYYSKPPLIAWTIAFTTAIFGDAEWAIRLASPFLHTASAWFIALIGRDLFGTKAGVLAGVIYLTMPGVVLSAGLISTDAILLTCWSGALLALTRLRAGASRRWAVALGLAIGAGLLAKYAMIYFVVGLTLATLIDAPTRKALLTPSGIIAAVLALGTIAPNLAWNAANDFSTVAHTADNANWSADAFHFDELGEFWSDQLAVFGPFTLILTLFAIARLSHVPVQTRAPLTLLLMFILPPLMIVSGQAFISRAHGNWAAATYVAATVFLAGWAVHRWASGARKPLWLGLIAGAVGVNILGGGLFFVAGLNLTLADRLCIATDENPAKRTTSQATPQSVPQSVREAMRAYKGSDCVGRGFKRVRGWREFAQALRPRIDANGDGVSDYSAIMFDNRLVFHDMEYYLREADYPLRMWLRQYPDAKSHAEERAPITPGDSDRVLVASMRPQEHDNLQADFARWRVLDTIIIDRGSAAPLIIDLFEASGFEPLERGPAYEAVYGG